MQPPTFFSNLFKWPRRNLSPIGTTPLTRKEFFELAEECRAYAVELARYDQSRVNLHHCHKFNAWLARIKSYERLGPALATLNPARPVARWQIITLGLVLGAILLLALPARFERGMSAALLYGYLFSLMLFYFVPERLYGTTIELLEAKVLRVVDVMERILQSGDLNFTEAAFFKAKENLEAARRELREQIDLAHRRWG
ncbi:MAG TPA: hypothetical protein VNK95_16125 [Caldilineaceae bacterium]|nr:hypothetical protein [Caldilineaceae bacterium]